MLSTTHGKQATTVKWGVPGTFPHVSDVKGRKAVQRPTNLMNVGVQGLRTVRRAKVLGNISQYLAVSS